MGKIIAVSIPKGGVGKTTTALNLSISLAQSGKRTLLIDADPSNQIAISLGIKDENDLGTLYDALSYLKSFDQIINNTENPNLDIIPFKNLSFEDELILADISFDQKLLKSIIQPSIFEYDFIIIDCPPYLVGMTTNVLNIADSVLIPVKSSLLSLSAVEKMMTRISEIKKTTNRKLSIEGLLLTMYEYNTKAAFSAKKELYKKYPGNMLATAIPKNTSAEEATFHHKAVVELYSWALSTKAYKQLADEIIENNNFFKADMMTGLDEIEQSGVDIYSVEE